MIVYILGHVMTIVAALMVLPFIVGLIYREPECIWFLAVLLGAGLIGLALRSLKSEDTVFYLKEGCVATGLSWIIMSLIGALPFFLSGAIPNFVNALFETVSGFTTTGASVIDDVEALSHCMLFWRSFTHWIGGMGILVFLLAIISMTGGS
ncbi:MAG: TrkH family potassium uptake protein, partial [Oscillospiraceae bacterium]|nr:TrkH family potassium uptake protein [Oscillospiraceae bacterium]